MALWRRKKRHKDTPAHEADAPSASQADSPDQDKPGLFGRMTASLGRVKDGLEKTRRQLGAGFRAVFGLRGRIDEDTLEALEELMITADMGVDTVTELLEGLRAAWKQGELETTDDLQAHLKARLKEMLSQEEAAIRHADDPPTVILVAGVNGSGKTTSIAKLAYHFKNQGGKVLLAASDTFRAAAVEQLSEWSQRLGVDIVRHQRGADPGAVTFDAADAALARKADVLIVDTAGRLHTERNLMRELEKISRVVGKKIPDAPHEVLLVLDATTGQNAIAQAKQFQEAIHVTGIFLTKLDGTAKGGIVVAVRHQLGIPVKFIGIGETPEDIQPFEPDTFVEALFE
jgi:fused signal recognition particle receptor